MSHLGTDEPRLLDFLSDHDADCPACGYGLRGLGSAVCPECAAELHLGVVSPQADLRPWLLAVVSCALGIGFDGVVAVMLLTAFIVFSAPTWWPLLIAAGFAALAGACGLVMRAIIRRRRRWTARPRRVQWRWAAVVFLGVGGFHASIAAAWFLLVS